MLVVLLFLIVNLVCSQSCTTEYLESLSACNLLVEQKKNYCLKVAKDAHDACTPMSAQALDKLFEMCHSIDRTELMKKAMIEVRGEALRIVV